MEISLLNNLLEYTNTYKNFIFWISLVSLTIFIISILSIRWLVLLIPENYFKEKKNSILKEEYFFYWIAFKFIKNSLGYLLIIVGILMLVLPGQGILTIFIGMILSDYPGKYYIEKKIIQSSIILRTINSIRKRSGKNFRRKQIRSRIRANERGGKRKDEKERRSQIAFASQKEQRRL